MECVQPAVTGIGILVTGWSCICECVNYKKILHENMKILTDKMALLRSLETDNATKLTNAPHLDGKKQKAEVETWLKHVQDKISEVQDIEQKVGKRRYFSRSWFLKFVEKNIQAVDELMENGRFPEGLFIDVHQDREVALVTTPLVGQSIKDKNLKKIWDCLIDDGITRIGVYGMGGIGKTTIATHIYNQVLESTGTFGIGYWVTVSQDSSIHRLQDQIAKIIRLNLSDEEDEKIRAAKLSKELSKREKFILILDDMWTDFPLEEVGVPIRSDARKLIVTSRSLQVCQRMKCQKNIKVDPLAEDEAWDLFIENLGCEKVLAPEIEKIAKSIANKCDGLPLAIVTTARSMRGGHVDDIREWRNALNELRDCTKGLIDMEADVFKLLKFSYDRLCDEKLQQCFLYCALFPEDYPIGRNNLIKLWIMEGLVEEKKTRREEFDKGHALLTRLEDACLLECTTNDWGYIHVKMHDVIREMALNITKINHQFMVKAGVKLKELPDEREWSENVERVSLMNNDLQGQLSCISPKCPRLRTLMLRSNIKIIEIPHSLFVYMQNLRVLEMSNMSMLVCLPDSISGLVKLQVLLLQDCGKLIYVPSLAKLTELRELNLCRTSIDKLPHGLEKLVNLKGFYLIPNKPLVFPSGVLPNLSHLQRLSLVLYNITDDVVVEELIHLRQLEDLHVCFYHQYVFNRYVKTQHWQSLSSYHLQLVDTKVRIYDFVRCRQVKLSNWNLIGRGADPLVFPSNMQEFVLNDCNNLTSLSDISSVLRISVRELERCLISNCEDIEEFWSWSIPSLEKYEDEDEEEEEYTNTNTSLLPSQEFWSWSIPSLEEDEDEDVEEEECTNTNTSLLPSLRTLWLQDLRNLRVVFNLKGALPKCGSFSNLKLFIVCGCPELEYVFTQGLVQHHLQNLQLIYAYNCSKMEHIIVADEEEEEITCLRLQSLYLEYLPNLKSIWKGRLVSHSLQQIEVRKCGMLKTLPLSLHSQTSSTLKSIMGEEDWWDLLEWDHPNVKSAFQPLFGTISKPEESEDRMYRASTMWWKDAEIYD